MRLTGSGSQPFGLEMALPCGEVAAVWRARQSSGLWVLQASVVVVYVANYEQVAVPLAGEAVLNVHIGLVHSRGALHRVAAQPGMAEIRGSRRIALSTFNRMSLGNCSYWSRNRLVKSSGIGNDCYPCRGDALFVRWWR